MRGNLVAAGDSVTTAHNILAHQQLYRLGGAAEFVTLVFDVIVAFILYNLLRPVSRDLAIVGAFFRLVFVAIYGATSMTHFAPLLLLTGRPYLATFSPAQLQSLALLSLNLHTVGYSISLVFFGVHCLVIGILIARSRFWPAFIGILLAVAGCCYVVDSLANFAAPGFRQALFPWLLLPGFVAEGLLAVWLTIRGLNSAKWDEAAARPAPV